MNQKEKLNEITGKIFGVAIDIHCELDPGLLESIYEACMVYGLSQIDMEVERQ